MTTTTKTTKKDQPSSSSVELSLDVTKVQARMTATHLSGKNQTYEWRIQQLNTLQQLVIENTEQIRQAICIDLGRDPHEALLLETGIVIPEIDYVKRHLRQWMKPTYVPSSAVIVPGFSKHVSRPLQPPGVLIIGPFNYPVGLILRPLIGVLAAGNPAVIKPSELCPNTSTLLKELFDSYFDPGVVQVVLGGVPETEALLSKPWAKVFFTGSSRVGSIVAQACAKTLTPTILELGGKCPVVIDEAVKESDLANAADRIVFGKFANAGQTCVSPNVVFVHQSHADTFCQAMVTALKEQYGENPKQGELARIINTTGTARLIQMIQEVEDAPGTKILIGGSKDCDVDTRYVCPTLIQNPPSASKVMMEEIFGPILPIVSFQTRNEVIGRIHDLDDIPLHMNIFVPSVESFEDYVSKCRSGGASQNDCLVHMSNFHLPFGGLGSSGYGNYFGKYSFDSFSQDFPTVHRLLGSVWDLGNLRCHPYAASAGGKGKLLEDYIFRVPDIPVLHVPLVFVCIFIGGVMYGAPPFRDLVKNTIADVLEACVVMLRR